MRVSRILLAAWVLVACLADGVARARDEAGRFDGSAKELAALLAKCKSRKYLVEKEINRLGYLYTFLGEAIGEPARDEVCSFGAFTDCLIASKDRFGDRVRAFAQFSGQGVAPVPPMSRAECEEMARTHHAADRHAAMGSRKQSDTTATKETLNRIGGGVDEILEAQLATCRKLPSGASTQGADKKRLHSQ